MLNNRGFDLWADDYDKSVGLSDEGGTYPFAGYKDILIKIYNSVLSRSGKVDFLNDIVMINNYRIGINKNLTDIQIMAGDINNSGEIDFIPDIVAMNNYRLGRIKVL